MVLDAIIFIPIAYKQHYDRNHQFFSFKVIKYVLLKLYESYLIPSIIVIIKKLV